MNFSSASLLRYQVAVAVQYAAQKEWVTYDSLLFLHRAFPEFRGKHFVVIILWKSLSWKIIFVEMHFVEIRRNNSYTQFFSVSVLLIPQLPLWLVGRPRCVRVLKCLWNDLVFSFFSGIDLLCHKNNYSRWQVSIALQNENIYII